MLYQTSRRNPAHPHFWAPRSAFGTHSFGALEKMLTSKTSNRICVDFHLKRCLAKHRIPKESTLKFCRYDQIHEIITKSWREHTRWPPRKRGKLLKPFQHPTVYNPFGIYLRQLQGVRRIHIAELDPLELPELRFLSGKKIEIKKAFRYFRCRFRI